MVEVARQTRGSINARTLLSNNTSSASSTVPVDFYDQLISYLIEVSGLLQTGPTILNTAGGETLQIPTVTSHPTATTAAQGGVIPSGDPAFAQKTLSAQKFGWQGSVARELIDDTAVDLLSYLAMAAGRDLGNKFGSALLNGGNGITGGLLTNISSTVTGAPTATVNAASATGQVVGGPSYANLIDLQYSVIAPYRQSRSCYWLASDQSLGTLRKLTDTVGRPLWEPSSVAGIPDMILGKPIVSDPFMPQFAKAANNFPSCSVTSASTSCAWLADSGSSVPTTSIRKRPGDVQCLLRGDGNLADANAIKAFQSSNA